MAEKELTVHITKTTLVATIIICFLLGMVGYQIVLSVAGIKLERVEEQPELALDPEKAPVDFSDQPLIEVVGDQDEGESVDAQTPASVSSTLETGTPQGETMEVVIVSDAPDIPEEEGRRIFTALGFTSSYLGGNRLLKINDVTARGSGGALKYDPLVMLEENEFVVLKQLMESPEGRQGKAALSLADQLFRIYLTRDSLPRYFWEHVIPTLRPGDEEVNNFYDRYKDYFQEVDERYAALTEHLKETIKVYLIRENLVRFLAASFQELALTKRLKLYWPEAAPPWKIVSPGVGQRRVGRRVMNALVTDEHSLNENEILFTLDDQAVVAGTALSMLASGIPILDQSHAETAWETLTRVLPPEGDGRESLARWLGSFQPESREAVVHVLFNSLAQSKLADSGISYKAFEGYTSRELKLMALINVSSTLAGKINDRLASFTREAIDTLPRLIQGLSEGCFSSATALDLNMLSDVIWTSLASYTASPQWLRVVSRDPLRHVSLPEDPKDLQGILVRDMIRLKNQRTGIRFINYGPDFWSNAAGHQITELLKRRLFGNRSLASQQGNYLLKFTRTSGGVIPAELPSPEDLKETYEANRNAFDIGDKYRFRILFHPVREVVEKARQELVDGMEFEQAIFTYGIIKPDNFDLELYPAETLKPEISRVLSVLKKGEVSQIFKIRPPGYGFAMVHLLEKEGKGIIPFDNPLVMEALRTHLSSKNWEQEAAGNAVPKEGGYVKKFSLWVFPGGSSWMEKALTEADVILGAQREM